MSKHVIDQPRASDQTRLARYVARDAATKPARATIALQRRAAPHNASRVQRFTAIERRGDA